MADKETGVSEALCRYAVGLRFEDIPGEVVERTKQAFLDFLGVAFGGHEVADSTVPVTRGIASLAAGASSRCTVLGEHASYPPQYAALLNGVYAHSMDFDDTHNESVMHPGATVFPTLLALGENDDKSGKAFLTAANVGYDVGNKIGIAHGTAMHDRGFHPTATTGIFGCTLAGASLLGLSPEETRNAFGLNVSQSAGRHQFRINGAWDKRVHTGLAAHNAILALTLARFDYLGSREPIEGRYGYFTLIADEKVDPQRALEGLGSVFEVMRTATKPYPCCRCIHSTIDAVLNIVAANGLSRDDIARIAIEVSPWAYQVVGEPTERRLRPRTPVDAQFSLYFGAAASAGGRYNWQSYKLIGSPGIVDLMGRIHVTPSPQVPRFGTGVTLETRDGRRFVDERSLPLGEPEIPMSAEECERKFLDWAEPVLGRTRANDVLHLVSELETLDSMRALSPHLKALRQAEAVAANG